MSTALPKAVQDQIDEANRILEVINQPIELNEDGSPKLDAAGKFIPIVETPAATPPVVPDEPVIVVEPLAAAAPPAEPAAAAPPADPPEVETIETLRHKHKVLQGKYNAEVPKLSRDLRDSQGQLLEMRQRVNNTESLLATMSAVQTPAAPATPPAPPAPVVSEEEIAQFGPDLIDLIGRVAEQKVLPQVDARIKPIDSRFDNMEETASNDAKTLAESNRDKLLTALTQAVPEWTVQNEDPIFLSWLNENDAYAGVPRGALLTQAFRANDAGRVIALFKGFQTENAVVAPEVVVTPPVVPEEPQQALEALVAPGTPKTGTTGAPDESGKRIWTRADISAFYKRKNEFITRGRPVPEEYELYEKDLFAAQREGRVR